jgi:hypothetical protein
MDVFTLFTTDSYTFLQLDSGSGGNSVIAETEATGVVKLRDGMTQVDNVESYDSDASVHIRPSESFIATVDGNLVGHGISLTKGSHGPEDYRIIRSVEGFDFDTGSLEFIRVDLKRESLWQEPSSLPLT